jgi:hypothetical protein
MDISEFLAEHSNKFWIILPCPFCDMGFELVCDYKFAYCKHAYHSWCVITHFFVSSKCLLNGCGGEMHSDWWALLGITKPCGDEKGVVGVG